MNNDSINALPGSDNILRKQFSNGVTVLVHENPWSDSAAVCGSLFAGACLDFPEKTGLSSFVSASLTAGTRTKGITQIGEYLENIGAALSFRSEPHSIRFKGNCLSEDLPGLLRLLKEILDEPLFPESYLESLRQQALAGYVLNDNDPEEPAYECFRKLLWDEDHPYGKREAPSEECLRSITRDDLLNFHRRFFGPKKMILTLSGGFCGQEVMDCCEEIFGSWHKPQEETDENALFPQMDWQWADDSCIRMHCITKNTQEITLVIGTFGPAVGDPDYISAKLGNIVLGEFGMMGRLGSLVRVENGLTYTVRSCLHSWRKGGCWTVEAKVDPADLEKAGEMIWDELRHFTTEPISPREFEDAKAWYLGSLPLEFGTNAGMASALHKLAFYDLDTDHYRRACDRAAAVTPETVLETARKWIKPKRLIITTAGPELEGKENSFWFPQAS